MSITTGAPAVTVLSMAISWLRNLNCAIETTACRRTQVTFELNVHYGEAIFVRNTDLRPAPTLPSPRPRGRGGGGGRWASGGASWPVPISRLVALRFCAHASADN